MKMNNMMKGIFVIIIVAIGFSGFIAGDLLTEKGLARVQRVQGKYVFIKSEPIRDYEVVGKIDTKFLKVMVGNRPLSELLNTMIKRQTKKIAKGEAKEFDAIVSEDGKVGTFIKFTAE